MSGVVEKARAIHRKYGLNSLDFVAEKLGARVYEVLDARHIREVYFPDLKAIAIKPRLPFYERAYLVAHGLGHHLLHQRGLHRDFVHLHQKGVFGSLERGRIEVLRKEREADLFAGYLLVPEPRLRRILREEWVAQSNDLVWLLALEFDVPKELMRKRLEYEDMRARGYIT